MEKQVVHARSAAGRLSWIDCPTRGQLATTSRLEAGDALADQIDELRRAGVEGLVTLLDPAERPSLDAQAAGEEAAACRDAELDYYALPLGELDVPTSLDDAFLLIAELSERLTEGKSLVIEGRTAGGNAAVIASAVLVATGLPPAQAIARVAHSCTDPIPDTAEQRRWIERFARDWQRRRSLPI